MKVSLDTGNFTITVDGEYSPEAQTDALKNALKYELQRDVVTKAYIALVGVDGKRGDSKVLPKGFERDTIPYGEEEADVLREGAEKALKARGEFKVSVSQHVVGEKATPMIRATRLIDAVLTEGADLEKAYRNIVLGVGANATREEMIAAAHAKKLGAD